MQNLTGKGGGFSLEADAAMTYKADDPGSRAGLFGFRSGLILFLMLCAVIVSFGVVLFKVWVAEQEAAEREVRSVVRVFENHKLNLLGEMERYAASNSAYINIETAYSRDWILDRFGADMARDFAYDFAALLGGDGSIAYLNDRTGGVTADTFDRDVKSQVSRTTASIRTNYAASLSVAETGELSFAGALSQVSGIDMIEVRGKPYIASSFAIVPDPGGIRMTNAPPHILITFFEIDTALLERLLASLSLDNLQLLETVPDGMLGVPLVSETGDRLGYLAWHPMSRASAIILASIPVLGIALGIILLISLITLRQNAEAKRRLAHREQEARFAADHDHLTGFASRSYFHGAAHRWMELRKIERNRFSVIYLDFDNLKQINDMHGHAAGDALIVEQAARIRKLLRKGDFAGRIGGDEFIVLTDRLLPEEPLSETAKGLIEALGRPIRYEGKQIETSCSMGIASFPEHGGSLTDLIRAADIALQRCKQEGKSTYRMYDARMDETLRDARQIRKDLDEALRNDTFELFYQPIVAAGTGEVRYFEALIRWRRPGAGLVMPNVFLPVARDAGLMTEIGSWVLEQAIRHATTWSTAGVSVNVSTDQIQRAGFAEEIDRLLKQYDFPPDRLILEITEDFMLEESGHVLETFEALGRLGVQMAIDDFGTGYSSLSYLHKFRFSKMKIDRGFVSRIGLDQEADMLVGTLLSLARILGMETVGEGVETEQQREFLVNAGCEYLQGYLFDRPMPFQDLAA